MRLLASALPSVISDPSSADCWAWKAAQADRPDLAALSEAITVVARYRELQKLQRRLRKEHTVRRNRVHQAEDHQKLLDCLTEACAFAWADLRGLGAPRFDFRPGMSDVAVPPDLFIEANGPASERSFSR